MSVENAPRSTVEEAVLFAVTEAQLLVLQDEAPENGARELLRWIRRRRVLEAAVQRVTDDPTVGAGRTDQAEGQGPAPARAGQRPALLTDPARWRTGLVTQSLERLGPALPVLVDPDHQLEESAWPSWARTSVPTCLSTSPPLPITMPFWESRSTRISTGCGATPTRSPRRPRCGAARRGSPPAAARGPARPPKTPRARRSPCRRVEQRALGQPGHDGLHQSLDALAGAGRDREVLVGAELGRRGQWRRVPRSRGIDSC